MILLIALVAGAPGLSGCASLKTQAAPKTDCLYRPTIPLKDATISYLAKNDRKHLEADIITNETLEKECGVKPPA
jgi:uncharacterized protein YceK